MNLTGRNISIATFFLFVLGLGLVVTINLTDACRLETIIVDGQPLGSWKGAYDQCDSSSIVHQPIRKVAESLLQNKTVHKVDLDFQLPHTVVIRTNRFDPVCFVVGMESGKLFGLDENARLIRIDEHDVDWERPVLTGLPTGNLYSFSTEPRVKKTIVQLEQLRADGGDLYRLLDQIDFSEKNYLKVQIAGLPYTLLVTSERLAADLTRFAQFTEKYSPDLTDIRRIDLRYEEMIICGRGKA